jgi:hypothetical protein
VRGQDGVPPSPRGLAFRVTGSCLEFVWKGLEDVEFTRLDNRGCLLIPLGYEPPAEFEQAFHERQTAPAELTISRNERSGEPGAVHLGRTREY